MMNISTHGHSRFQDKLDKFFWFAILVLPIVFFIFLNLTRVDYSYMDSVLIDFFGMDVTSAPVSLVTNVFNEIFGNEGIFPFFQEDSGFMLYFVYFVYVQIIHVLVDVLVFIPRFAHKVLSKAIDFGG